MQRGRGRPPPFVDSSVFRRRRLGASPRQRSRLTAKRTPTARLTLTARLTPTVSPILNFSSALPTCSSTSSTCRQSVTITISHPNDDYYCLNYGIDCPWAQMYFDHPWNGTLSIQTDDTVAL